jgi:hypothetical protein
LLFAVSLTAQTPSPAASSKARSTAAQALPPATSSKASSTAASPAKKPPTPPPGSSQAAGVAEAGAFTKEQLEQLVAPIALYPDGLLSQLFMAATYPLQVVEASRFMEKNSGLEGDALNEKLKEHDWDVAVKSLCTFPEVLKRMNDNLDWMQDLGDAVLGQKTELLDAVQVMRGKAYDSGNLKSNEQQEIKVEKQPPPQEKIIVIESKDPEVVYVPTYSPTVVYGGWGYPYWYYPGMYPYYPYGYGFMSFTAGVIVGGAIWGSVGWGWGHSDIDIDIDNNFDFDRNTSIGDRNRPEQRGDRAGQRGDGQRGQGGRQSWQHNAENRKGVNYRDRATAQKYGGSGASSRVSSAEARGRAGNTARTGQAGSRGGMRQADSLSRQGGAGVARPGTGARDGAARPGTGARDGAASRASSARSGSGSSGRSGAYSGSRSPGMDRSASSRGSMSRGGGGFSRGGGGGFSRGGGGGRRR